MTVAELGQRMSSRELSEWMLYEELEPFSQRHSDYRTASICHVIAASNGVKDAKLEDYLLTRDEPQTAQGEPDVLAFARMMGAKVVPREPE